MDITINVSMINVIMKYIGKKKTKKNRNRNKHFYVNITNITAKIKAIMINPKYTIFCFKKSKKSLVTYFFETSSL